MIVYLLRHGIAENHAASGLDSDRALTGEGFEKLRIVLRVAAGASVRPDVILTSPYRRAMETAAVARDVLKTKEQIVQCSALTPESSPQSAWNEIRNWSGEEEVLIASHEPLVSSLLSYLLGVTEHIHDFKKAGLAKVQMDRLSAQPAGTLLWLLTPALAHAIAAAKR